MGILGGLFKPIWAKYEKVVELERDLEIVKQYAADYWLHKKEMYWLNEEMSELKEQLADTRSEAFMLQRSIDYLKIKMKEAQNV